MYPYHYVYCTVITSTLGAKFGKNYCCSKPNTDRHDFACNLGLFVQFQAFLRYLSTINHTLSWYQQDQDKRKVSLKTVRKLHSAANKKTIDIHGKEAYITQFDMVTTQFAFIGAAIILPKRIGLGTPSGKRLLNGVMQTFA